MGQRCLRATVLLTALVAITTTLELSTATAALVESRATAEGVEIRYVSHAEVNSLSVSIAVTGAATALVLEDSGAGVTVTAADPQTCAQINTRRVECAAPGLERLDISLGELDDALTIRDALPFDVVATGGNGTDILTGSAGRERLVGGPGNDSLLGGPGNDLLDFGGPEDDDGSDTLDGGPGDDRLSGGREERPVGDTLRGGDGTDWADYRDRTARLTIDLDGDADDGEDGEGDNVGADVENVIGGSDGDTVAGSDAPNELDGRDGGDTLLGRGGNDTLRGGVNDAGSDKLAAGAGDDRAFGGPGDDGITGEQGNDALQGEGGTDRVEGGDGDDTASGGPGGDDVFGGEGNDTVLGGAVDLVGADAGDTLKGDNGIDDLLGGDGDDDLDGGGGPDTMHGEAGIDTVTYANRSNPVTVTLDDQPNDGEKGATPDLDEKDNVFRDVERIVGGDLADTLSGDRDRNTVEGGRGQDLIDGRLGRDVLDGGRAADVVDARDGERDEEVDCGAGEDLAILDAGDRSAIDCEFVDRPDARNPVRGTSALVRAAGPFGLQLPDGPRWFEMPRVVRIPTGSTINPKAGVVHLTMAASGGGRRRLDVSRGRFELRQRTGRRPQTMLELAGPRPECDDPSSPAARISGILDAPSQRSILVDAKPRGSRGGSRRPPERVVVRGPHSVAASRGTKWLTEERCDGTLTTVLSGSVRVRDRGHRTGVTVRPGKPHLSRARLRRG